MTKPFDVLDQIGIDQKIVSAFEKISLALRMQAWMIAKPMLLNPAQTQLLTFLLKHKNQVNRVGLLAKEFIISKATISDTLSSLERKELIYKLFTPGCKRNFVIQLTPAGEKAARQADLYTAELLSAVNHIPGNARQKLFAALGDIILHLHSTGQIPVQRMCLSCKYHQQMGKQHYCNLLKRLLKVPDLQIDCPDYQILIPGEAV